MIHFSMYEPFYGFRERPFDLTPNPRFLVWTKGHREALSNLEYAIACRKGVTVLLGQAGVGKTTIIRSALELQQSRIHCVHVQNPALTRAEFIHMLATRFSLSPAAESSKSVLLVELEALLRQRDKSQETTVLLVDEAQSLSRELLEELRLLENIETDDEKLITLVLAGQPELGDVLNRPEMQQLKQRVALRCELRALTVEETFAYVAGRIAAAGGVPKNIFTREAVMSVYERSSGIPRTINVLCDNALIAGFASGQQLVDAKTVQEVAQDFSFDAAPGVNALPELQIPARVRPPSALPSAAPAAKPVPEERVHPNDSSERAVRDERVLLGSIFTEQPAKRRRFSFLRWGQSA